MPPFHRRQLLLIRSKVHRSDIKGCKIVLPRDNHPREYEGMGVIAAITQKYGIEEVKVGGVSVLDPTLKPNAKLSQEHGGRGIYYKNGYLIDFPRTVNKYGDYYDGTYQVEVFGKLLERQTYFTVSAGVVGGKVCSWNDFEKWLDESKASLDSEQSTSGGGSERLEKIGVDPIARNQTPRKGFLNTVFSRSRSRSPGKTAQAQQG
jgi:hypothetical protein